MKKHSSKHSRDLADFWDDSPGEPIASTRNKSPRAKVRAPVVVWRITRSDGKTFRKRGTCQTDVARKLKHRTDIKCIERL